MISLIINPAAGGGLSRGVAQAAEAFFKAKGLAYEILHTTGPRDATELARKAAGYADLVVSDGGDGTIREIVAGLAGTDVPLGILPGGRGNDFRRSVNVPDSVDEALEVLTTGEDRMVDLLDVNGEVCANVYSIGFDVAVVANSHRFSWFKALGYYLAVFYTCITYRAHPMHIEVNGEVLDGDFYLIAFGNGCMYGGGMKVLPDSVNDDGLMDICLINSVTIPQVIKLLPSFMKGEHGKFKDIVRFFRTDSLKIRTPEPMDAQADGEILPSITETVARVLPGALKVRAPKC